MKRLYAISGSIRAGSTNRALLFALRVLAPSGVEIEICDLIGQLPIFNPDLEGESLPPIVATFFEKVEQSDGLIISCPEYAHGIPGGVKNALDWLVPNPKVPFKPVMLVHASHRGDQALEALRHILQTMSLNVLEDTFFRLSLVGKKDEILSDLLQETETVAMMRKKLDVFLAAI